MLQILAISGCMNLSSEPIPHRSIYSENSLETIWFDFSKQDRFDLGSIDTDVKFIIHNGSNSSLTVETRSSLQKFEKNGWNDIGYIYLEESENKSQIQIGKETNNLERMFNLNEQNVEFEPGRYRLIVTLEVMDEDSELFGQQEIGKVFWLME